MRSSGVHAPDGPAYPRTGHRRLAAVGRWAMRLTGWTFAGELPPLPKFVLIVAPHTSNWDFMIGLAAKLALQLEAHWFGKDALFRWPLGILMRRIGGRPIHRDHSEGVVGQVADTLRSEPRFILVITPEGTRKRVDHWRTGFYHIARAAGVPVVPVAFDWGRKEIRIMTPFEPSGDADADIAALHSLYDPAMAFSPKNFTAVDQIPARRTGSAPRGGG
jgi:1-acyl-sn-glycerol-3-phosphate acyltransferase